MMISNKDEYQVFLSFRRPDIHCGFTNTLFWALTHAGIHAFIDDEERRSGEKISGNLLQVIDDSRFYIPIFSTNYTSSHWCLCKLAKMVENTSKSRKDGNMKVILPIFYDVEPDDVMRKIELYINGISKLGQSMEEVEKWWHALAKVDATKRWEVKKYSSKWNLIQSVVKEVEIMLQRRRREVTDDLVGMEDRIVAINNLLDIQSGGVRFIGIHGMGGVGKTTLAKIIFDQLGPLFGKNCSFLDDIRETVKTKGFIKLQEQLLSNISNPGVAIEIHNIDHGITRIGETIYNKKVLIVLDDVDECNQIQNLVRPNFLYPGSRILVTTRDKSILNIRGFEYKFEHYEMEPLGKEDALILFNRYAFNDNSPLANYCTNSPIANYYTLPRDIVSTVGGLPLALQTIGSLLSGLRSINVWEETLRKLKKILDENVLSSLMLTYECLCMEERHIFLDVACFFIGDNKLGPISLWKDYGFEAEYAIEVLIKKRMIKVLDGNRFWMHDQLRDLGKRIAKREHTRLWETDDIICELRSTEIKGSVQAIRLKAEAGNPVTITAEQIKRFPHLQFLWLSNVICRGDLTGCLSELKWISLHYYHTPKHHQGFEATNLPIENLVVIQLSGLQFTPDKISSLIKGSRKLKVLTVCCDAPTKVMSRI